MSNIFAQIKEAIQSVVGGGSPDSVVGLDIGASAIKLVQLKKTGGKIVLETYGAVATGPYVVDGEIGQIPQVNVDSIVSAITDLFREANVTARKVVLSVQSASSLIFVLSLPPVSDNQLAQIVPTEATKYIPVPLSEVNFDWWRIPTEQTGPALSNVEVLVAAIRNETIRFYQKVLQQAKLEPISFEIETFSGARSSFDQELKPVALVDFGASSTRIAIMEYGVIRKFQTINRGTEYYTTAISKSHQMPFKRAERLKKEVGLIPVEGDTERTRIAELLKTDVQYTTYEVKKALLSYEQERGKVVSKIIAMGGGARMPGFVAALSKDIGIQVEESYPFNKVQVPSFLSATLKEVGPEFAVAIGAALKTMQK